MGAISVQSEQGDSGQSVFGTRDPVLAATLGNLGFQAMNALPVLLVVSASAVVDLVDRKSGRVADCAHLEFRFESEVLHEVFGPLNAHDVCLAHEIAKLAQKEQTKELVGSERLTLVRLRQKWQGKQIGRGSQNHAGTVLWAVQILYDQISNFLIVATVSKELAKNPLIAYTKELHRGVAYAIEPAENESIIQRRSERLFHQKLK